MTFPIALIIIGAIYWPVTLALALIAMALGVYLRGGWRVVWLVIAGVLLAVFRTWGADAGQVVIECLRRRSRRVGPLPTKTGPPYQNTTARLDPWPPEADTAHHHSNCTWKEHRWSTT